jgi:hypothetical protein
MVGKGLVRLARVGGRAQATTPTELNHSARRWREAATLGNNRKMKTTLKELWRGGDGWDATPSELNYFGERFPRVAPKAFGATLG